MPRRNIIVIGGSAGSLRSMDKIVRGLPKMFEASVFVVLHLHPRSPSLLPHILNGNRAGRVVKAQNGQPILEGHVYVAPPDHHLMIQGDHIHVTRSPKEGLQRPSINVTFRSAAVSHGPSVVGVLLSGMLDDGASGLWDIARHGGLTIVQDPSEASFPSMPISALEDAPIDFQLTSDEIAPVLTDIIAGREVQSARRANRSGEGAPKHFSGFTCPECRGPLYEFHDGPVDFRCRVGHRFSLKTLLDESVSTQERKLYEALVALEEGADMAEYAAENGHGGPNEILQEATQLREHAAALRKLIEQRLTSSLE